MTEKIKGYWEKCKEALKKFPKKLYISVGAGLLAVVVLLAVILLNRPYSVLFTKLNASEATAIVAKLEELGYTDYRMEGSDTILVPKSQENTLRGRLIGMGYPQSGVSYADYYENVGALSTESERTQAYLFTVQSNMAATIRSMEGVQDAVVGLAMGQGSKFVLDGSDKATATATVKITMQDGQKLSSQMAAGIRNYVAHGVWGLEMSSVAIMDNFGNQYNGGSDASAGLDASQLKLMLEEENNNKIRNEILWQLEPLFGPENVRVSVSCTVDVNRVEENATNVYLPDWANDGSTNGEGIIGSKIYDNNILWDTNRPAGGAVGTGSNADLPTYVEKELQLDGTETGVSTSGQVDYDNSKSQTHTVRVAGYITDCSVAVTINRTTAGAVDVVALTSHVARAANIQEEVAADKISILPMAFYTPPAILPGGFDLPFPVWWLYVAGGALLLLIVLIIVVVSSIKRKRRRKRAEREQQEMAAQMLAAANLMPGQEPVKGADVMSMQTERSMELRKDIRKFVDENPEIAAQMVKSWLRGGEEDG